MKILIASTNAPGHLNPLLGVASILRKRNHEVVVQAATAVREVVEAAGLPFLPFLREADLNVEQYFAEFPERQDKSPSLEMICFDFEHYFARLLPGQAAGLEMALRRFPADVVLVDSLFFGTLPMLLGPREKRPAIVHLGISVLNVGSGKNVPARPGVSPKEFDAECERRERLLLKPVQAIFNATLTKIGCRPLPCPAFESMSTLPDLYLHPGIRSFEYPDKSPSSPVQYIGPLPLPWGQSALPDWWHELDMTKRLVLVTQGTIANRDFGQLVGPALVGLAEEKDLILLVTTGGQPIESIPVEIPANARVAKFLPYDLILQSVDLLITNGGYGTVNMALAHGIPIISAGLTEDKEEVSAHVQWAGIGIDLRTNQANPEAVRTAARKVLDGTVYRERAKELAFEFASHDTETELLHLIEACVNQAIEA
jgi:UDP:flavonoid glycosyltransferase YjiC (YdhE family)